MPEPASFPQPPPGQGRGRRPIPADTYILLWGPVVVSLKTGLSTAEIKRKHGTCAETVRRIRKIMMAGGWVPPIREKPKKERPVREPRPPRVGMTKEERLQKYPGVASGLRAGKTMKQVAELEGVSVNTVRVVRRALLSQGEVL